MCWNRPIGDVRKIESREDGVRAELRRVIIELHANDDSEKSGDDWHERMLAKPFVGCDGLTDLSLSRERPSRASVPDSWRLAKHEGLQARASVRLRVGCSEKLGRTPFSNLFTAFVTGPIHTTRSESQYLGLGQLCAAHSDRRGRGRTSSRSADDSCPSYRS